jgi:hypothetical protein
MPPACFYAAGMSRGLEVSELGWTRYNEMKRNDMVRDASLDCRGAKPEAISGSSGLSLLQILCRGSLVFDQAESGQKRGRRECVCECGRGSQSNKQSIRP